MSIVVESKDIQRIDINHRERDSETYGYVVLHFKDNSVPFRTYHFNFAMKRNEFDEQLSVLQENAERSGFEISVKEKSRFILGIEMALAGALAGIPYMNHACPSCRMIDTFIAGGHTGSFV